MKKVLAVVAAVGCLAAATVAFGGLAAGTGVNGSLHDMTRIAPNSADAMGRVCVYCHAPHHAKISNGFAPNRDLLPLWNHEINDDTFTPYVWATPSNEAATITDVLAGPSRLCMSCHDGVTAVDEHGSNYGGTFSQTGGINLTDYASQTHDGTGRANLTTDLSNTHPIGFDYIAIATARNNAAKNASGTAGGTVGGQLQAGTEIVVASNGYAIGIAEHDQQWQGYNAVTRQVGGKTIADNLYRGTIMTCATCHEVHNKENATQENYNAVLWGGTGTPAGDTTVLDVAQPAPNYFLYAKQYKSLICLSCHVK